MSLSLVTVLWCVYGVMSLSLVTVFWCCMVSVWCYEFEFSDCYGVSMV